MARRRGRGWSGCIHKVGMLRSYDASGAFVQVKQDGSVVVMVGSVETGSGTITALAQIAAEELGVPIDGVSVVFGDTDTTPFDSGAVASRSTYIVGNAVRAAAQDVKGLLLETVADEWDVDPGSLESKNGFIYLRDEPERRLPFDEVAFRAQFDRRLVTIGKGSFQPDTGRLKLVNGKKSFRRDATILDLETGQGDAIAAFSYMAVLAEVDVDTETGEVEVVRLILAADCGRAINPMLVEGQMEGGAMMGLGYGLTEDTRPGSAVGRGPSTSFMEYVVPTAMDTPDIETIIVECPDPTGPFGAKGVGEIASIPVAPAICNAIYDAVGVRITSLPATPDRVLAGILQKAGERQW